MNDLLSTINGTAKQTFAWCVLPNHYHVLAEVPNIIDLCKDLGKLHGRAAYAWNGEDNARGRKVFYRVSDRAMRSDRHFWATMNYIHHNPVHHGYVERWEDWPWSSASQFLAQTTRERARQVWFDFPINEYGSGWDDPER